MITCKDSVRFSILRIEILRILERIWEQFNARGYACVITCGTEAHGDDDPHTHGFALDLRSKHIPSREMKLAILESLRQSLGSIYTVILENEGLDQEHFHIQVRRDLWRTLL